MVNPSKVQKLIPRAVDLLSGTDQLGSFSAVQPSFERSPDCLQSAADEPMFGLGLRPPFYEQATKGKIAVDWLELITENFMVRGGRPLAILEATRTHYPIAFHGVSMNLGGSDALDKHYLQRLKQLIERFEPLWISDHLCWTRHGGHYLHDLLPLPYAEDVINHVAARIRTVQDYLGQQILIENLSSYAEFAWSPMCEWEFLTEVAERADCLILLDINNIIVSAHNHKFDPHEYLRAIPHERVVQHHVAGHSSSGPLKIDTHDYPVAESVWNLYQVARRHFGPVPVCLERDDNIPPLSDLLDELGHLRIVSDTAITQ